MRETSFQYRFRKDTMGEGVNFPVKVHKKEDSLIDTSFKILLQRETIVRTKELTKERETRPFDQQSRHYL